MFRYRGTPFLAELFSLFSFAIKVVIAKIVAKLVKNNPLNFDH